MGNNIKIDLEETGCGNMNCVEITSCSGTLISFSLLATYSSAASSLAAYHQFDAGHSDQG
jgi:hypothetical protein